MDTEAVIIISAGISVLVVLLWRRYAWLEEVPLSNRSGGVLPAGKIRLRHVLQVAMDLEERGIRFYRHLADTLKSETGRALCDTLMQDEIRHHQTIREMMGQWRSLPLEPMLGRWYEERIQAQGIFSGHPGAAAGQEALLRYAIDQEERMAAFYAAFEKEFPQAWKRVEIQQLVLAERSHAAALRRILSAAGPAVAPAQEG